MRQGVEWVVHSLTPTCNEQLAHFVAEDSQQLNGLLEASYQELFETFYRVAQNETSSSSLPNLSSTDTTLTTESRGSEAACCRTGKYSFAPYNHPSPGAPPMRTHQKGMPNYSLVSCISSFCFTQYFRCLAGRWVQERPAQLLEHAARHGVFYGFEQIRLF